MSKYHCFLIDFFIENDPKGNENIHQNRNRNSCILGKVLGRSNYNRELTINQTTT